ncbi:MAG: PorT family protein [Sphingobacterium sp.]|jgi:hypothetical protein|uniref:porin family protein n=1 Tax=Sphingobacterium sp. TaxID=341027 RepID=UPI00284A1BE0|nr:porin family protein [Sphingobacterium sp.]MDR3010391.1 PorT family protein [Sphingobacterium sp.]
MKRKLLSIAAALCFIAGAKAQTSYGIKAGLNFSKLNISQGNLSASSDASTNFYVTGYADLHLANNFSVQPGVSLQGKGGKVVGEDAKLNLMYIEVPVNLVYSIYTGEVGNIFLGAGPYAGFGVSAKAKSGNITESGSFSDAGLKTFDAGANFLAGFKFANGFLINGGYSLGLTNFSKYPDETGNFKNRVFSVGVGFQF